MLRHRARTISGFSTLLLLITLLAAGCPLTTGGLPGPPPGETVQSSKQRIMNPDVPDADAAELAAGNTAFALDLYQYVRGQSGNIFFSPYSISIALAMTYAGARGETERQMAEALHFTLGQDRLHPAFNALDLALASRGEEDDDGKFQLNVVNKLWGRTGYEFLGEFLDILAEHYGAGLQLMDFVNAAEDARVTINDWIAAQTANRIQDLIPPGAITPATVLVMTNAIYFKAAWRESFEERDTRHESFTLLDGTSITVPMMTQEAEHKYLDGDGFQAVELLYDGDELSMLLIMPDEGNYEAFEGTFDAARLHSIVQALQGVHLRLSMPRFAFDWSVSLGQPLSDLGMPIAFGGDADLSGMNGIGGLFIEDVIHKAFVAVDEAGTEAAAATAVITTETSVPPPPLPVIIDRPFLFVIRDIETEAILFLGRLQDPR